MLVVVWSLDSLDTRYSPAWQVLPGVLLFVVVGGLPGRRGCCEAWEVSRSGGFSWECLRLRACCRVDVAHGAVFVLVRSVAVLFTVCRVELCAEWTLVLVDTTLSRGGVMSAKLACYVEERHSGP